MAQKKVFPGTVFVSTGLPEKRIRVTKSQQELEDLDDDITDMFKSNNVERYGIRPDSVPSIDKLCFAERASSYCVRRRRTLPNFVGLL